MVRMHEKLMRGERVDPNDVSTLILAGIIKIINQHDLIDNLDEKVNDIERENLSNKFRIESLENWVISQGESISRLDKKVELEFKELKENELGGKASNDKNTIPQDEPKNKIKCKECGKTFSRNHQLEEHMEEHSNVEKFNCETCNKDFFLKWRLQKHIKIHSEITTKVCKYFKNKQTCPYERIGCMFGHVEMDSGNAASSENVVDVTEDSDDVEDVTEDSDDDESFNPCENQCHLCRKKLESKDGLWEHVEEEHKEYFNGMLEVAAYQSKTYH
jgi:hypothetical protein